MATGTISKEIIKISKTVTIAAASSTTEYTDTTITFGELTTTTAIPLSVVLRSSSGVYNYFVLPYGNTVDMKTYVYQWNSSTHTLTIRNFANVWNNYEITVVFLQ